MKELTVFTGVRGNYQQGIVRLNGTLPEERLTPKMARRALRVAQGNDLSGEVWDIPAGYGYRVYRNSARKVKAPSEGQEEEPMDRVQEINRIEELAQNIAQNLGEGTAEELVEYALSDEGRESWGIDIELDDYDRGLLVQCVAKALSQ